MFQLKSIVWENIVVLLLGLIIATPGMSRALSQQLTYDDVETRPEATSSSLPAEGVADSESSLLAMNTEGPEDQAEMLELLAVLEEETEIATKTKMNGDYVPGMVTVLHGEQLEALGVRTVVEALTMVPGIQIARSRSGEPFVKVRGMAFPFNAGNVKVMLNSIALSRESSGIDSSVLLTPVAQVDRIEVIRGPGSTIYGEFAMAGVVNIITKNTGGRLFSGGGKDESWGGGGHYSYRDEENSFGLGLNISVVDDGESATAFCSDPDEERYTGVFNLQYRDFTLTAEAVRRRVELDHGPPPGGFPPGGGGPTPQGRYTHTEKSWAVEGRQTIELGRNASLEGYLSYLRNDWEAEGPQSEFRGDRVETGLDVSWLPWSSHQLLLGLSYTRSDTDDALDTNPGLPGSPPREVSDTDDWNYSLGIQDQISLGDRFSLTLGVRFDDYDDVGSRLTPRIAGVYRPGEHHVIKAQYSEGFRPPTFWELHGAGEANRSLDFEVIETTELAYVYRRPKAVGRLTLFHSEIDDGIFGGGAGGFENHVDIESKGVEVEWEQQIHEKFRWLANVSYVDTKDDRSNRDDNQSTGIADWLGNLAFFLEPLPKYMVSGRLLYVGDRHGSDKGSIDGYKSVDLTVSRMDLVKKGITLRAIVKNVFDDEILYLNQFPSGLGEDEFRGRTLLLQFSYDF